MEAHALATPTRVVVSPHTCVVVRDRGENGTDPLKRRPRTSYRSFSTTLRYRGLLTHALCRSNTTLHIHCVLFVDFVRRVPLLRRAALKVDLLACTWCFTHRTASYRFVTYAESYSYNL